MVFQNITITLFPNFFGSLQIVDFSMRPKISSGYSLYYHIPLSVGTFDIWKWKVYKREKFIFQLTAVSGWLVKLTSTRYFIRLPVQFLVTLLLVSASPLVFFVSVQPWKINKTYFVILNSIHSQLSKYPSWNSTQNEINQWRKFSCVNEFPFFSTAIQIISHFDQLRFSTASN